MKIVKSHVSGGWTLPAALVLACAMGSASCKKGPASAQMPPPPTPEVGVITIQPERVPLTAELAGRISASLVAEVRPQVTGIIQKRLFEEGADVKEGDVLYQIDAALYEAADASAKAALARTEANLKSLRAQAARSEELIAIHAISQQEYDNTEASLKQAEAELEANKAAVETARINLNYTKIKAPISGRIGRSAVTVGALVTANQGAALAVIQQLDPVYTDAPQTSANLLRLKQEISSGRVAREGNDASAHLLLEDGSTYAHAGVLKFSDVTVNPTTGSFILRTSFPNPEDLLLPGMYVRVVVEEGVNEQGILVPQRSVTFDAKGRPVALVVNAESKAEPRMLVLDRSVGEAWLVSDGLRAGDRLIIDGVQRARPGSLVSPVPFGSTNGAGQVASTASASTP